jgi:hypothetical protein
MPDVSEGVPLAEQLSEYAGVEYETANVLLVVLLSAVMLAGQVSTGGVASTSIRTALLSAAPVQLVIQTTLESRRYQVVWVTGGGS